MTPTTILIGGATGATGSVAAKLLLGKGFPVRAFVHADDERAHQLQALGAEIFVGELLDFRAVRRAFEGIKRAYFVYPMRPGVVQATAHYAQAAQEALNPASIEPYPEGRSCSSPSSASTSPVIWSCA